METQINNIVLKFEGKLIASRKVQNLIAETLLKFPWEVINFVTDKVWFMSSFDDAWGYAFNGNDLQDQHLIFLSDDLFRESKKQIMYTIAHEIGHIMLNHRNAVGYHQSSHEISKQEKEADEFATYFLSASKVS